MTENVCDERDLTCIIHRNETNKMNSNKGNAKRGVSPRLNI